MTDKNQSSNCPLCTKASNVFYEDEKHLFYQCMDCRGIFRSESQRLSNTEEIKRYLLHRDPELDEGYYQFILPLIEEVRSFAKKGAQGLDYGCGQHKFLLKTLTKEGFNTFGYDPLFLDDKKLLKQQYDFIVCCEVIEHFFHPLREFQRLKNILVPQGKLICKTDVYDSKTDFETWYYKNDPTHVFIYMEETFEWIRQNLDFKDVKVDGRVINFSK
ncbi:class I SAM-dependent methyltransferase [Lutimonas zeaxanthinifaciens]|uniref:class I SAM-dependent methyltransferase n=1 Tax=Lutimonas zeaxanthinifaciens TaxID=3060215 RepID=UPI00265CAD9A|nr:class I SAM-dependent methyltransferase [Lutimonas sp. YSD2104]WKK66409.1 class I SAM-dependent methyltransferase [Lutimonas sp. YSD2104]